jgi:pSer/pThr/pTyr-binding forkhead associated (FHA) protein
MTAIPIEDEFKVPQEATLEPSDSQSIQVFLETSSSSDRIPLAPATLCSGRSSTSVNHHRCFVVGRQAATADIRIPHKSISRTHAVLYFVENSLYLVDGGGKYGTTINNTTKVPSHTPVVLADGDTITFGNARDNVLTVRIVQSTGGDAVSVANETKSDANGQFIRTLKQQSKRQAKAWRVERNEKLKLQP